MNFIFNPHYQNYQKTVEKLVLNFKDEGTLVGTDKRNAIKYFDIEGKKINIKSFKTPNFINKIVYRYFRKSKASRSFEFAQMLISNGFGTPEPIAYCENSTFFGLLDSYYISEHLDCDLTFRELVLIPEYPENEIILRQFTQFCYQLHQKGIEFKDHSPGNTLIKKQDSGAYAFYLVDLNRMELHEKMSFNLRMKNLCRLTHKRDMVAVMANEYAKCSGENEATIFTVLWKFTSEFQFKFDRKQAFKKKYLGK